MKTIKLIIALVLLTSFFVSCTPQDSIIDVNGLNIVKPSVAATNGGGSEVLMTKKGG